MTQFKQNRKPVGELCRTDEVLTVPYWFEARVERIIWQRSSFGAKPYFLLKAVHIRTSREHEEASYLGTLEDGRGHVTLLPITDTITQLGLKSMDILRFKARLKYRPKDSCSIIVYQARDVEVLGSLISRDEEGVEDYE